MTKTPTTSRFSTSVASGPDLAKAALLGVAVAWSLSTLILVATNTKISPLPQPLGVAFAHRLFAAHLAKRALLPIGLLLHTLWVVSATVLYVVVFRRRLNLANAFVVAAGMWLFANVVILPAVGWGLFAARQGAKAAAMLVATHALFAIFAWALCATGFSDRVGAAAVTEVSGRQSDIARG